MKQTVTITFGDRAENHAGMQIIGNLAEKGYSLPDLEKVYKKFTKKGSNCELICLNDAIEGKGEPAYVLVIRDAVNIMLKNYGLNADDMYKEQIGLKPDTKAIMRGKLVNKRARYNLCFAEHSQESSIEEGKGTIVAYSDVPCLINIHKNLRKYFGQNATNLYGEGNYYYDPSKCGIGFHGDSERKIVIALRLGKTIPLVYQWFCWSKPVGELVKLEIRHGDIYVMSEKAVGFDWKKRSMLTLRHAAGCKKYIIPKKVKGDISKCLEENGKKSKGSKVVEKNGKKSRGNKAGTEEEKKGILYIYFYDMKKKYSYCSNFYQQDIEIDGEVWPTVENYFQAMKYKGKNASKKSIKYSNIIKSADSPGKVFILGRQKNPAGYQRKWVVNKKTDPQTLEEIYEKYKNVKMRKDWEKIKVNVMIKGVVAKFMNKNLREKVAKLPDNIYMVEHTTRDNTWADGGDCGTGKKGSNYLGKILTAVFYVLKHGDCNSMKKRIRNMIKIGKK